jgi:hypothetical protein
MRKIILGAITFFFFHGCSNSTMEAYEEGKKLACVEKHFFSQNEVFIIDKYNSHVTDCSSGRFAMPIDGFYYQDHCFPIDDCYIFNK